MATSTTLQPGYLRAFQDTWSNPLYYGEKNDKSKFENAYSTLIEGYKKLSISGNAGLKAKRLFEVSRQIVYATSDVFEYVLPPFQAVLENLGVFSNSVVSLSRSSSNEANTTAEGIKNLLLPIEALYTGSRDAIDVILKHPTAVTLRYFFLAKQTNDLFLTYLGWLAEEKTNENLVYQSVNTLISWSPILIHWLKFQPEYQTALFAVNLVSTLCLVYSIHVDYKNYYDPSTRIKSPSYQLLCDLYDLCKDELTSRA